MFDIKRPTPKKDQKKKSKNSSCFSFSRLFKSQKKKNESIENDNINENQNQANSSSSLISLPGVCPTENNNQSVNNEKIVKFGPLYKNNNKNSNDDTSYPNLIHSHNNNNIRNSESNGTNNNGNSNGGLSLENCFDPKYSTLRHQMLNSKAKSSLNMDQDEFEKSRAMKRRERSKSVMSLSNGIKYQSVFDHGIPSPPLSSATSSSNESSDASNGGHGHDDSDTPTRKNGRVNRTSIIKNSNMSELNLSLNRRSRYSTFPNDFSEESNNNIQNFSAPKAMTNVREIPVRSSKSPNSMISLHEKDRTMIKSSSHRSNELWTNIEKVTVESHEDEIPLLLLRSQLLHDRQLVCEPFSPPLSPVPRLSKDRYLNGLGHNGMGMDTHYSRHGSNLLMNRPSHVYQPIPARRQRPLSLIDTLTVPSSNSSAYILPAFTHMDHIPASSLSNSKTAVGFNNKRHSMRVEVRQLSNEGNDMKIMQKMPMSREYNRHSLDGYGTRQIQSNIRYNNRNSYHQPYLNQRRSMSTFSGYEMVY